MVRLFMFNFYHKYSVDEFSIPHPIDLVYTWVNGSDSKWLKEKEYWQIRFEGHGEGIDISRYIDNQELRYSLRSVFRNAPWFHRIFIVTNGQVPDWLDIHHPKIRMINHRDIMPIESLPTFNSEAIEVNLCNIPGLSEYFVYANDDCFIYRPILPRFFFRSDGYPYVGLAGPFTRQRETLYYWNVLYSSKLMKAYFNRSFTRPVVHNMRGYRKSDYTDCMKTFHDEVNKTTYSKFRVNESVQISLVSYYSLVRDRAVYSSAYEKRQIFIRLSHPFLMNFRLILHPIKHRALLRLLCINDYPLVSDSNRRRLKPFLQSLFPIPAPWELDMHSF